MGGRVSHVYVVVAGVSFELIYLLAELI